MITKRGRNEESSKSRRSFLSVLLGSSLVGFVASILYPVLKYLHPPAQAEPAPRHVLAGKIEELRPNKGKIFRVGTEPGILIRTPRGEYRAFSAVCTHLACTVQYREDLEHIWCACHDGHYDLYGNNIAGPPP